MVREINYAGNTFFFKRRSVLCLSEEQILSVVFCDKDYSERLYKTLKEGSIHEKNLSCIEFFNEEFILGHGLTCDDVIRMIE